MQYVTKVIGCVAIFLFFYTFYKYLFYSGDCCPLNYMSVEVNSLLNLIGLGTDFIFWMIPVIAFFWPTKHFHHDEVQYRHAKRRWSTQQSSKGSSEDYRNAKIQSNSDTESNSSSSSSSSYGSQTGNDDSSGSEEGAKSDDWTESFLDAEKAAPLAKAKE